MTMEPSSNLSTGVLRLAASLDLAAAAPLAADLLSLRGAPVEIDASAVRRIGGQCLQVILAAQTTWASDQQTFRISDPSADFVDGVVLLGASALSSPIAP